MSRLDELLASESQRFFAQHPASASLAQQSRQHWLDGVPMHWMADWGTPHPLFVREAAGATLTDVDGHRYADFCLGDTGAMFGHSPPAIAQALAQQGARGLTCMLPAERTADVGAQLAALFGLPYWQIAQTATDANRYVLRWARAITGKPKVLVFQGCYHGTVEETMVRLRDGRTVPREGAIGALIGAVFDPALAAVAVEFNAITAVEAALDRGDIGCVLYEPVMTNIGMVLPEPGFHEALREATRRRGLLLIIDETHTLSSGQGGYTRRHSLEPDLWVCGKAIAGGLPCAVFGFTAAVEAGMQRVLAARDDGGHSGMGTTLAANPLVIECLHAALTSLHTAVAYEHMEAIALRLETGLRRMFAARALGWHVSRVGARVEFGFGPAPHNGSEAEAAMRPEFEHALHLYCLNRGILITPFHNMMLSSPATQAADVDVLIATLGLALDELGLGRS